MSLFILNKCAVTAAEFVDFWEQRYAYKDARTYDDNIRQRSQDSLIALFRWKVGERLYKSSEKLVRNNFIDRLNEWQAMPSDTSAAQFLGTFSKGGAIWRIFWLHCWNRRFPIYDQHVHRAMVFIETNKIEELTGTDADKIKSYLNHYLPFFDEQFKGIDGRLADRALWAFGKFIKAWEKLSDASKIDR